jgi:hypothetical protein
LKTTEFSFGKRYDDDSSYYGEAYYQSINNEKAVMYDLAGTYVNTTKLETTLNGLALPPQSYVRLVNLLSIVSSGDINCNQIDSSSTGCLLPKQCSEYTDLWEFSFKVQFTNTANTGQYWLFPLATIASNVE